MEKESHHDGRPIQDREIKGLRGHLSLLTRTPYKFVKGISCVCAPMYPALKRKKLGHLCANSYMTFYFYIQTPDKWPIRLTISPI